MNISAFEHGEEKVMAQFFVWYSSENAIVDLKEAYPKGYVYFTGEAIKGQFNYPCFLELGKTVQFNANGCHKDKLKFPYKDNERKYSYFARAGKMTYDRISKGISIELLARWAFRNKYTSVVVHNVLLDDGTLNTVFVVKNTKAVTLFNRSEVKA